MKELTAKRTLFRCKIEAAENEALGRLNARLRPTSALLCFGGTIGMVILLVSTSSRRFRWDATTAAQPADSLSTNGLPSDATNVPNLESSHSPSSSWNATNDIDRHDLCDENTTDCECAYYGMNLVGRPKLCCPSKESVWLGTAIGSVCTRQVSESGYCGKDESYGYPQTNRVCRNDLICLNARGWCTMRGSYTMQASKRCVQHNTTKQDEDLLRHIQSELPGLSTAQRRSLCRGRGVSI
jgi:hypothetical protein